jgi:hypothetical protein
MYRLNCRSLMCLLGISLSPTIAEERLMPAPKTRPSQSSSGGHPNCRYTDQDGSAVPHSDAIDPGIIDALTSGLSVAFPEPRLKARF